MTIINDLTPDEVAVCLTEGIISHFETFLEDLKRDKVGFQEEFLDWVEAQRAEAAAQAVEEHMRGLWKSIPDSTNQDEDAPEEDFLVWNEGKIHHVKVECDYNEETITYSADPNAMQGATYYLLASTLGKPGGQA